MIRLKLCPGGALENSPAIHRWETSSTIVAESRQGRLMSRRVSPTGAVDHIRSDASAETRGTRPDKNVDDGVRLGGQCKQPCRQLARSRY